MAQTDVDVCNQAGVRVGLDPLDGLDEETPYGAFCLAVYPDHVTGLLSRHRWVFANRFEQLTQSEPDGVAVLEYAWAMPADIVGAVHAVRSGPRLDDPPLPHIVNGQVIYTDSAPAYVEYTRRMQEGAWPGWFAEFAITAFAVRAAMFMEKRTLARELREEAWGTDPNAPGGLFLAALQADGRSAPQRTLGSWDAGPLIDVRATGTVLNLGQRPPGFDFVDFD